ncbi:hypothetical protein PVK06_035678 [Gossypium arboreum]|uniref:Uncharacterized protein n=1 Tax=Gossypium arboreum TaxID=29729 RepID=A0ABR0NHF6_GOSAR|nr:hypothetical protein PVK06_035678 [Gossypium arboreum]
MVARASPSREDKGQIKATNYYSKSNLFMLKKLSMIVKGGGSKDDENHRGGICSPYCQPTDCLGRMEVAKNGSQFEGGLGRLGLTS